MGCTTGVAYLLLVINDVRPLKDNSITSSVMCNQSLSRKWICTRVTKSVAKALSIQADLKIYATTLVACRCYTFATELQPTLSIRILVQAAKSDRYGWFPREYNVYVHGTYPFTLNCVFHDFFFPSKTRMFARIFLAHGPVMDHWDSLFSLEATITFPKCSRL